MVLTQAEQDNVTRWDGERRGFYEVYYLKVNHIPSGTALWARYTLLAPQETGRSAQWWCPRFR